MDYYPGVRMPFPSEVPHALHYRWLAERGGLVTHQNMRDINDWSSVQGISLSVMGRVEWDQTKSSSQRNPKKRGRSWKNGKKGEGEKLESKKGTKERVVKK